MSLRHFISRLVLCFCLFLLLIACNQTSSQPQSAQEITLHLKALQRSPLHLPMLATGASCPTTPEKKVNASYGIAQGKGPAYATIGAKAITSPASFHYITAHLFLGRGNDNQGWGGQKVLWFVDPGYQGLILVRGHQLDGPHEIRFGTTADHQLVLNTTPADSSSLTFGTYTRLQAPGCYAYQVDGDNFRDIIIFQATV